MSQYRTKQGDLLDAICAKHYPSLAGVVEQVLEANINLASYGAVLPAGLLIELPEIRQTQTSNAITLW